MTLVKFVGIIDLKNDIESDWLEKPNNLTKILSF